MITTATRFFCAALSTVGAAGLVAFSAPSVTIAATPQAHAPQQVASTAVAAVRRG